VVLGMGGYVTVPGGLMARLRGVPLVLVNADAALLLSNKTLAPLAQRVLFGFPADFGAPPARPSSPATRCARKSLDLPRRRSASQAHGALRILVVGGSLGAKVLNDSIAGRAGADAGKRSVRWSPTSRARRTSTRCAQAMPDAGVKANVVAFIDDMAAAYAEADLVICRAGAITVSELTAAGVASVLVPFVASTTSHQRDNAQWMAGAESGDPFAANELNRPSLASCWEMSRGECRTMAGGAGGRQARRQPGDRGHIWNNWQDRKHET
jgi:UDP-N-acetylglucosamine--N-acetylmuramyl-(pentapeptide) pyrophosphoryl-undecaprenol N-acetylglucosamine transferase